MELKNPITARMVSFIKEVGLEVEQTTITEATFLPGIRIDQGRLLFDEDALLYPGDLLHEAGHLAVMLPEQRRIATDNVTSDAAEEMMAILWSYAAALHIGIDVRVVFHPAGYKGGAEAFVSNFSERRFIGLPMLQWIGLTYDERNAKAAGAPPFPHMLKWLREAAS
jgi:hypothetical protein